MSESTSTIEFERFDPRKPPDCFSSFTNWQTNPMLHHHQNSQYISRSPQQASHSLHSTWATTANNPRRDTHLHQSCQKKKWQNHTTNWRLLPFPLGSGTTFQKRGSPFRRFATTTGCCLLWRTTFAAGHPSATGSLSRKRRKRTFAISSYI